MSIIEKIVWMIIISVVMGIVIFIDRYKGEEK